MSVNEHKKLDVVFSDYAVEYTDLIQTKVKPSIISHIFHVLLFKPTAQMSLTKQEIEMGILNFYGRFYGSTSRS